MIGTWKIDSCLNALCEMAKGLRLALLSILQADRPVQSECYIFGQLIASDQMQRSEARRHRSRDVREVWISIAMLARHTKRLTGKPRGCDIAHLNRTPQQEDVAYLNTACRRCKCEPHSQNVIKHVAATSNLAQTLRQHPKWIKLFTAT